MHINEWDAGETDANFFFCLLLYLLCVAFVCVTCWLNLNKQINFMDFFIINIKSNTYHRTLSPLFWVFLGFREGKQFGLGPTKDDKGYVIGERSLICTHTWVLDTQHRRHNKRKIYNRNKYLTREGVKHAFSLFFLLISQQQ